ncbi:hypothetical protein [Clostridium sp. UBA871]|uniref:hypothetical protein n=1 Tax=Clostridium sp. UBA871 TaxID=1946380 RepID=UPI003216EEB6
MSSEKNKIVTVDILGDISNKINQYLDIKEDILENDFMEVLGDSFKVLGILRRGSMAISRKRFIAFLKGFNNNEIPIEQKLKKLSDYINSEQKAEFISDIFSKILLSRSTKACLIMGAILQKIVENKNNLSYSELICINSLTTFFDDDIELYKYICQEIVNEKNHYTSLDQKFYNKCNNDGVDVDNMDLMIEKCISNQLLLRDYDVDLDINEDDVSFSSAENDKYIKVSKPGMLLYKYICDFTI